MRSRFALLLLAAAVIFAPGWHGQGPPPNPRGSDLAARVLAPTVDEGAIREATPDIKHQLSGRHANRWNPGITFEVIATFGLGAMAFVIFWVCVSFSGPFLGLYWPRFRFGRAPPRIQPG
jgi:hypothetical protein